jgi:hypothetical protein
VPAVADVRHVRDQQERTTKVALRFPSFGASFQRRAFAFSANFRQILGANAKPGEKTRRKST